MSGREGCRVYTIRFNLKSTLMLNRRWNRSVDGRWGEMWRETCSIVLLLYSVDVVTLVSLGLGNKGLLVFMVTCCNNDALSYKRRSCGVEAESV